MSDDTIWAPYVLAGYDEWSECLGAWMAELMPSQPWTFESWARLYGLLLGHDTGFAMPVGTSRIASAYGTTDSDAANYFNSLAEGSIRVREFLCGAPLWVSALDHLWGGAAVHRAAGDWSAHLAYASVSCSREHHQVARILQHHYYALCGNGRLDEHWARNPYDPGCEVDPGSHRAHAGRLWDFAFADSVDANANQGEQDDVVDDTASGSDGDSQLRRNGCLNIGSYLDDLLVSPRRMSYRGESVRGNQLVEVSESIILSGGWPAITAAFDDYSHRALLRPEAIERSRTRVVATEIVTGDLLVLDRLTNTDTGWLVRRSS